MNERGERIVCHTAKDRFGTLEEIFYEVRQYDVTRLQLDVLLEIYCISISF